MFYSKTTLVVYMYKDYKLASISNPHVFQAKNVLPIFRTYCHTILYFRRDPSIHVLDWCVVHVHVYTCTGLVCGMYWTGVLYVLDWCVVCTGLLCCMYWTGHTSPIHQPSAYTSPVQRTSPVHNTLYVLCCMYSTGMLYEGGGKGVGHCPCTFTKEGRWW